MVEEQNPFAQVLSEIFGRTVDDAPTPEPAATRETPTGFGATASTLLKGLGLPDAQRHDSVRELVETSLADVGLDASVGSFRFGVLTIDADPVTAHLLRFVTQRLLEVLSDTYPGEVTDLVVRVRRPRRQRQSDQQRP